MPDDRARRFRTEDGIYLQVTPSTSGIGEWMAEAQLKPFQGRGIDLFSSEPAWFDFADAPDIAIDKVLAEARQAREEFGPP